MALAKYGGGIIQMSGSIAGNTYARNRFGNYVRSRTKPTNPKSSSQILIRSAVSYLTEYWHETLDATQRLAWSTYAAAINMKNRLGETVKLTGFNHFCRSNAALLRAADTLVEDGPVVLALPEKDPTIVFSASEATQNMSVSFNNALEWANEANGHLYICQGRPQLATRNFYNGPWRYAGAVDGSSPVPPPSPATIASVFPIAQGQNLWIRGRIIRADGRLSEPMNIGPFVVGA